MSEQTYIADLNDVVTVTEIHEFSGISKNSIIVACRNGWIDARQSGGTWLMRRKDAVTRWGLREAVPSGLLGVLDRFSGGEAE